MDSNKPADRAALKDILFDMLVVMEQLNYDFDNNPAISRKIIALEKSVESLSEDAEHERKA